MSYHREASYKANLIDIQKADPAKLEEYKRIFDNSPLYNHYFKKNPKLLEKWLVDFMPNAYIAVDRNGNSVGWASISASDPHVDGLPNLTLLAVKDTARGRGIGQMLLNFYMSVMQQLGFEECAVVVNDWNPRARKLYDSLGFKLRKSFEDPFVGSFVDHMLVKKL